MITSRSVTRFTGNIEFLPLCTKGITLEVVVLDHSRRVTFCTHVIPVVENSGPVQRIARRCFFVGEEWIPAGASLRFRCRPCDGKRLQPSPRSVDQNLLAGTGAEEVANRQRLLASGVFDLDHRSLIDHQEARQDSAR